MAQTQAQTQRRVPRVALPAHLRLYCRGAEDGQRGGWDIYGTSQNGKELKPLEGLTFEEINELLLSKFVPFLGEHGDNLMVHDRPYGFRIFSRKTNRGNTVSEMEIDGFVDKTNPKTGEVVRWYVTLTDRAVKAWLTKRDQMPAARRRTVASDISIADAILGEEPQVEEVEEAEEVPTF